MKKITLGILGGGQLGRMSALAAARLGIEVVIFTPEENSPASQVVQNTIIAEYSDEPALKAFSEKVDVISYEFENIPVETVRFLQKLKPVYPDELLLEISQDRIKEKTFLNNNEIPTTRWAKAKTPENVIKTMEEWGQDKVILKTTRFGYDGKGQSLHETGQNINDTFSFFNGRDLIIEELVDFSCEISVIIARDQKDSLVTYGPMQNEHKDHILSITTAPAQIDNYLAEEARALATKLAEAVNLIGVMTLEMFVTKDGQLLANEIAPRTHNSGHWTIDACKNSQFDQHVRTICGLPVGTPERHSDAVMLNLIGDDVNKSYEYLDQDNACIHLYGKNEPRPERKMGHITILKPRQNS